jgi:hypothetical protein
MVLRTAHRSSVNIPAVPSPNMPSLMAADTLVRYVATLLLIRSATRKFNCRCTTPRQPHIESAPNFILNFRLRYAAKFSGAAWSSTTSLVHMKLRVSEKFRKSKEKWHKDPRPQKSHVWTERETQLHGQLHRSEPATGVLQSSSGG